MSFNSHTRECASRTNMLEPAHGREGDDFHLLLLNTAVQALQQRFPRGCTVNGIIPVDPKDGVPILAPGDSDNCFEVQIVVAPRYRDPDV